MGAPPPMTLSATRTAREARRERVMAALLDGHTRDRFAHVRGEVELAVVEEHAHVGRVADDDPERRPPAHFRLAPRVVEAGEEHFPAGIAHLDPRLPREAQ